MMTAHNSGQAFAVDVPKRSPRRAVTRTAPPELAPRWARIVALVASGGIVTHLLLRFAWNSSGAVSEIPLYVALVLGGAPLVVNLSRKLWAGVFGSDFLAGVSIVTAVFLQEYLV